MDVKHKIAIGIFSLVWFIILTRIFFTSVVNHEYYAKYAKRNILKTEILVPVRGQILDRNNEPIAINELGFSLLVPPKLNKAELEDVIEHILKYIGQNDEEKSKLKEEMLDNYAKQNSSYNHDEIKILDFLPYASMHSIYPRLSLHDNLSIEANNKRLYPHQTSASHVIGYVGNANENDLKINPMSKHTKVIGKTGIEKQYNSYLQGNIGKKESYVDSLNREVEVLKKDDIIKRNDLVLSLDMRVQEVLDNEFKDKSGSVIVMDVNNGEILAAGSYPEYNINSFVNGISYEDWNTLLSNPENPMVNKFINGMYPPGSVIKMGMGMAILEYANIHEKSVIETPYFVEFAGRKFRDWKYGGHGSSDLIKAIRESVDVYFYILSQKAKIENINVVLSQMGFGQKTGVDIPNEFIGVLPNPEWKLKRFGENWYIGDTIISSIGQGFFLSTPLQVTRYSALIATGKLPTPHFAKATNEGEVVYESQDVLNDFQKSKLQALRLGMYQVCNDPSGTGYKRVLESKVPLACKTGTAQVVSIPQEIKKRVREQDMEYYSRSHAWFIAYLPYKNPKYAITVMIEHGGSGGNGGPITARIANKMLELGYIQ